MRWRYAVPLLLMAALIVPLASGEVADPSVAWCIPLECVLDLEVRTGSAINLTRESVVLRGNLVSLGNQSVLNVSFEWGISLSLDFETALQERNTTGVFNEMLLGLQAGQTYFFRARAVGPNGTDVGAILSFTTEAVGLTPQDMAFYVDLIIFLFFTGLGFAYKNEVMLFLAGIIGIIFGVWLMAVTGIGAVGLFVLGPGIIVMVIGMINIVEEYR